MAPLKKCWSSGCVVFFFPREKLVSVLFDFSPLTCSVLTLRRNQVTNFCLCSLQSQRSIIHYLCTYSETCHLEKYIRQHQENRMLYTILWSNCSFPLGEKGICGFPSDTGTFGWGLWQEGFQFFYQLDVAGFTVTRLVGASELVSEYLKGNWSVNCFWFNLSIVGKKVPGFQFYILQMSLESYLF